MVRVVNNRTRHNPVDVRTIRGFPENLKLFRMSASKYWYVRMYIRGRASSGVKKSTRCENIKDAEEFAVSWYEDRILEKRTFKEIGAETFKVYADRFQETQQQQIRRGELVPSMFKEDQLKLKKDILPTLGNTHISKIDYNNVNSFIDELRIDRNLSQSTLKKYVVLIRKVLKEAERDRVLNYIPNLPTITRKEFPRPWFKPEEYKMLLSACRDLRDNPKDTFNFSWEEMYDFIVFMVHSFLRPSEWKYLQNRHIRLQNQHGVEQLVISVPNPKTKKGLLDSTTTEVAADIYKEKILKRHDGRNDYIFFNDIKDRERYASDRISRMFRVLCEHAELTTDSYGQKHTTYSIRHSALCFQILKTKGEGLFALAKNARTSVEMLEKFYLSHLTSQLPQFTEQLLTNQILVESLDD